MQDPTTDTSFSSAETVEMSNAIRFLAMDAVEKAKSGHPGMPMGMADVATVLFQHFLKFDPMQPHWSDRDRFILSAGHGSMLHYALLHLTGYEQATLTELKNFRQLGSRTAGHPEFGHLEGIETTTGPLGQGLANAVGMSLAEKMLASRFGKEIVDHYTYVIAGDGCLMEGISHEAISLAGHLQLNKLIVLFDDNHISIDGPTDLSVSDDQLARFKASDWHVIAIDGHDHQAIYDAIAEAKSSDKPTLIACDTTIAYGAPTKAGTSGAHGAPLGSEEIQKTREGLEWPHDPFEIDATTLSRWRSLGQKGAAEYSAWKSRYDGLDHALREAFDRGQQGALPTSLADSIASLKQQFLEEQAGHATRKSSGLVLESLTELIPELVGGSADLTGSNLTKTTHLTPISASDFSGRYVYYGVREHGMAACMNGMALHKGFIPYGGTFLVFTDYCRPSIRLSALMQQRVIYVMTHDSIGLGEDGPTHQPIEHLASLRAMPNVNVLRPCDAVEVAESWELALENTTGPTILALSRQNLPMLRKTHNAANLSSHGFYILEEFDHQFAVTLFASGSEVQLAVKAKAILEEHGIGTRVVSCVSTDLFDQQDEDYQSELLDNTSFKVAIEAAASFGWDKYIGRRGLFIGMESFGASAPINDLYEHFGITTEVITQKILNLLED